GEVDARPVREPEGIGLIEGAAGELHRLGQLVRRGGHVEHPDVRVTPGIVIALIVAAVDRAGDDVDIRLMVALRLGLLRLGGVLGAVGCRLFFAAWSWATLL